MTPHRWSRSLATVIAMAACGASATAAVAAPKPTPSAPAPASPSVSASAPAAKSDPAAVESYWTADRLASAVPLDAGKGAPIASPRPGTNQLAPPGPVGTAPKGTPKGVYGDGIPALGTFFFNDKATGATYCSASIVRSAHRNLVLTAGHCAKHAADKGIFIPQFRKGKAVKDQPFGGYPVQKAFLYANYEANSMRADSDLDFAFLRVGPEYKRKKQVEDVTGAGLRLRNTPRLANQVTVHGYPHLSGNGQRAISCTVPTERLAGFRQMLMRCSGFYGGVSGGPWITGYNAKTRTGDVVGNVGGYYGGGPPRSSGHDDWVSYSPVYGQEIQDLYRSAVADRAPGKAPLRGLYEGRLPGGAGTWKYATHVVAADLDGNGRDDLLVIWKDGEATLYPGDGRGGFGTPRTLAQPKSFWKNARSVTAGDFTGDGRPDLMVLWAKDEKKDVTTGKVSVYSDISAARLSGTKEYVVQKAGSGWKYATAITAGAFNSAKANDVVVRWKDGDVTLHSGVTGSGTGRERTLVKKDAAWKDAVSLTTGQLSGKGTDLLVRRANGTLEAFSGITASSGGLGKGTVLQPGHPSYTRNSAMAAGNFTGSGRRDDLLVRWVEGETSLYEDTTPQRIGTWKTMVSP
ncbi:FG-GAP-like repeat-containing protein [Streptomyces huiliensis]|uniref:FG-GAP-like repeat-containing protein n=1 Tax=Streptomyces huiliensis TaxID=2876027 RepID=UPI001CBC6FFA|nr:FG-GAP-like repeat-containing protein [Streptomyces huiliensis]MBZ4319898.1 FG-GAP-like repeat-containing protein [Streptomyces huiliensis]